MTAETVALAVRALADAADALSQVLPGRTSDAHTLAESLTSDSGRV
jgi:hypothetical protein